MTTPDIFLTYNREDAATAKRYADAFAAEGLSVRFPRRVREVSRLSQGRVLRMTAPDIISRSCEDEVMETTLRQPKAGVCCLCAHDPKAGLSRLCN